MDNSILILYAHWLLHIRARPDTTAEPYEQISSKNPDA